MKKFMVYHLFGGGDYDVMGCYDEGDPELDEFRSSPGYRIVEVNKEEAA